MAVPIPYVHAGIGLVTILLAMPLIFRQVPMNTIYGVRTRGALVSKEDWYRLNVFSGQLLFLFGVFLLGFAWFSGRISPEPSSPWAPVFLFVPLLAIVPVLALIDVFARSLPDA